MKILGYLLIVIGLICALTSNNDFQFIAIAWTLWLIGSYCLFEGYNK
jgi:hypothetical protein